MSRRARKERGAKLVVVDPYRTGTAEVADMHLMLRPGTDGALACAVMHVLFAEGYADRDYMARYADVPGGAGGAPRDAHAGMGRRRSPALAGGEIVDFARLYGRTKRSYIRARLRLLARRATARASMHAVTCLPTVTGAWQHPGGGALYGNRALYQLEQDADRGAGRCSIRRSACSTSRASARC